MPLSPESLKVLESVKKTGNPCRFVLVKKEGDVAAIAAYRKGSAQTHTTNAKQEAGGGGETWSGVIEGQGVNLTFKLLSSEYKAPPVKDSKLKDFLKGCDKAFKDNKASFAVVDALPNVADEDDQPPPRPTQKAPFKYRTSDEWKTVIAAIQNAKDKVTQGDLHLQAAQVCKTESEQAKIELQADPTIKTRQEQSASLAKVSEILKRLTPQMPQAPSLPGQAPNRPLPPLPNQFPPVPLTPPQQRRKAGVDLVDSKRAKLSESIQNAKSVQKKPFGDDQIDQLALGAKQAAEETRLGVHKDKTLISIADELTAANDLALRGQLALAHAKLAELQQKVASGKAAEEKERKSAILAPTKQIHDARIAEYGKLGPVIDAAAARIGAAISEATHLGNELCSSVKTMLAEYQKGTIDVLNAPLVAQLEALLSRPGVSDTIAAVGQKLLLAAKSVIAAEYKKREGTANTPTDKAQLLLDLGICSGSQDRGGDEKGNSDSFFLKGPDGKLQYVLKPMQGESVTTPDWVQGGGPVREVLSSKLNDIIKGQAKGFDCRGLPTEFVSLDDPSLARGGISKETKRTGSLQSSAPPGSTNVQQLFAQLEKTSPSHDDIRAFKAKFNEDDCQAIALRQFLTFDQDAHGGNMMVHSEGDGPGQTRLIPIDAGQSMPSPSAAKRNAASLRLGGKYNPDFLNPGELLLPQLPSAMKPFSGKALEAIEALDPVKLAGDMKAENDKLIQQDPSVAGKVDPGAFDLTRKSAKFLKLAAKAGLTLREISMVYGEGFSSVVSADGQSEDQALKAALDTALYLKNQGKGFDGLDAQFQALGWGETADVRELRLDQKERILKNNWTKDQWEQQREADLRARELADIGDYFDATAPESVELRALVANGFHGKDMAFLQLLVDHRRKGGDPVVKAALAGNDATLAYELQQPVKNKASGSWDLWKAIDDFYKECGGNSQVLFARIGPQGRGLPLDKQIENYRKVGPYEKDGGDTLLRTLGQKWVAALSKSLTQDPTGKAIDDQIGNDRTRKQLPQTSAELDTLLDDIVSKKASALTTLKAVEKKKII